VITVLLLDQYENNVLSSVADTQKNESRRLATTLQYGESQRASRIYVVAGYLNIEGIHTLQNPNTEN
jgi:hypothetical protein